MLALEKHYRVPELATVWGLSRNTISREFRNEPGVIKIQGDSGKRSYATLRIPESVVARVHQRLSDQRLQPASPGRNPFGVKLFGNLNTGMPKKPREVIKRYAAQYRANRKSVA